MSKEKPQDQDTPPPAANTAELEALAGEFQPETATPGAAAPAADTPPAVDRRVALAAPLGMLWKAACAQAANMTEVQQLNASPEETETVAAALAQIADVLLPEDVDPNSKAGQIIAAGSVLFVTVQGKVIIYRAEMAAREAAANDAGKDKGAAGGNQP